MNEEKKAKLFIIIGVFLVLFALFYLFMFLGAQSSCQGELIKNKGLWVCGEVLEIVNCVNHPEGFDLALEQINFSLEK